MENKFIFVLGSNFKLSLAELDNVLNFSRFKGKIVDYSANIAVVEFEELHKNKHYINDLMELQYLLGGIQKISKIFDFVHINTLMEAFPTHIEKYKVVEKTRSKILTLINNSLPKMFKRIKNEKLFFAVSIYPNFYDEEYYKNVLVKHLLPFLNKEIMNLLRELGAKQTLYYKYPEENIQSGNLNPLFPHNLIKYGLFNEDRAEIVFGITEEGIYIGRTYSCDDPSYKKKIDEERPFREFKSSISPKLAIIMLNFLNLFEERESKKILDPFVGNGTILLLATIEDFQVYGTDNDAQKVNNTYRNLNWLFNDLEEEVPYQLKNRIKQVGIKNLSEHFEKNYFDGICTEPDLGPFFRAKPYYKETMDLIQNQLIPLYSDAFREAEIILKPSGRIAIIAPIISTIDGGDVYMNIEKIALNNNFKVVPMMDLERITNKSNQRLQFQKSQVRAFLDAKKGQVIKRKIFVFEKN
ncbi:MAG: TRM11 family SAM-dependent methyltransferase [Promethearchaeota archaeon]